MLQKHHAENNIETTYYNSIVNKACIASNHSPKVLVHIRMHKKILSYDELYLQQVLFTNGPACDKYCVQQK